jgi:STE24 endopeptidase
MKRLMLTVFSAFALLCISSTYAASPTDTSKSGATATTSAAPAAAPAAKHFDADEATQEWLNTMSPEARAKSDAYFEGGYWLILWDFVVGLVIAWLFLGTRLSPRLRDAGAWMASVRWLQWIYLAVQCIALLVVFPVTIILAASSANFRGRMFKLPGSAEGFQWPLTMWYAWQYLVLSTLISLPWDIYEGYVREHQYGMSNQDMAGFLGEQIKGLIVALILGTIAIVVIYAVIRKFTRTWWIWGAAVAVAFVIFVQAIGPSYLEPVFNTFYPIKDSPLKQQILSMARANGIPATDVYEFDASKQTKRMSAHVSGLGSSVQISMNDNLMNRGSPEEIKAVLGHEMGHYVLNHVYKGTVFIAILAFLSFAWLNWSFGWAEKRWSAKWGLRGIADVAALPLLIALFSVFGFVTTPVNNTITRTMEAEADAFGINTARLPDGFAQAAIHLSEYRKMEPGKWEEIFFYDHPSGYHRIHRVMVWKAEHINDADIAAYDAAHPKIEMPDAAPAK